jgi:hypothetical protein
MSISESTSCFLSSDLLITKVTTNCPFLYIYHTKAIVDEKSPFVYVDKSVRTYC